MNDTHTTSATSATATDAPYLDRRLARDSTVEYGVPVLDFGEDGDMVAIGHHEPRRVIAAMNAHYRRQHHPDPTDRYSQGIRPRWAGDLYPNVDLARQKRWWATYQDTTGALSYLWWRLLEHCDHETEPHHNEHGDCHTCVLLAESTWVAAAVPAGTPDAFPVVVWEP